jgi:hypothetical protein
MPAPSILPLFNAIGLVIVIVNITGSVPLLIAGAVLFLTTAGIWIRSAARETSELPLEHH